MDTGAMEGWPFPSDFRDPNEAWDLQGKLMFFTLYTGFWSCMVLAVFLYTRLHSRCSSRCSCRRQGRSPVKRQSNGFGDVLKMSEAFGDMPPFPESKARQSKRAAGFRGHRLKLRRLFANVQVHELFLEQAKLTPTGDRPGVAPRGKDCGHLPGVRFRSREPRAESACPLGS